MPYTEDEKPKLTRNCNRKINKATFNIVVQSQLNFRTIYPYRLIYTDFRYNIHISKVSFN